MRNSSHLAFSQSFDIIDERDTSSIGKSEVEIDGEYLNDLGANLLGAQNIAMKLALSRNQSKISRDLVNVRKSNFT